MARKPSMKPLKTASSASQEDAELVRVIELYRHEAEEARRDRMNQNQLNMEMYHLKQDWGHKQEGQSREFLPKMSMAVEQNTNFLLQGLMDVGTWFSVDPKPGMKADLMRIKPSDVKNILQQQLLHTHFMDRMSDFLKMGQLGSLMIAKVHGKLINKPKFTTKKVARGLKIETELEKEDELIWQLCIEPIRHEDYYPDPTGKGLYEMQDIWMDLHEVKKLAKGPDAIYDAEMVDKLSGDSGPDWAQEAKKAIETNQNITTHGTRRQIRLTEFWGTVVDESGEVLHENVTFTVANKKWLIQKPKPNPFWHQKRPFVVAPLILVPNSVWHRAPMDAPVQHNKAMNELYNLMFDAGMMAVHGIKQLRTDWLDDDSQVAEGIVAGTTLKLNSSATPGAKVLETVSTSSLPPEALQLYNIVNQEFNVASMTNDLRLGAAPFRQVKATEVVEASNTLTGLLSGMAKQIEMAFITPILELSWAVAAQNMEDWDSDECEAILGKQKCQMIKGMAPAERFAETVAGMKYSVFGITNTLQKRQDFMKYTTLLQTVGASEVLIEEFSKKYDFGGLLSEIMRTLNIPVEKIEIPVQEQIANGAKQPMQQGATQPGTQPNNMSQVAPPQAGGSLQDVLQQGASGIPQTQFPGSRATRGGVR